MGDHFDMSLTYMFDLSVGRVRYILYTDQNHMITEKLHSVIDLEQLNSVISVCNT